MNRFRRLLWPSLLAATLLIAALPLAAQDDESLLLDDDEELSLDDDEDEGFLSFDDEDSDPIGDADEGIVSIDDVPELEGDGAPAAAAELIRDFYSSAEQNWGRHIALLDEGLERFAEGIRDEPPPKQQDALDVLLGIALRLVTTTYFAQLEALDAAAVGQAKSLNISKQLKASHPKASELESLDAASWTGGSGASAETAGDWIQQARKVLTDEAMSFRNRKGFIDAMEERFAEADEDERLELYWELTDAYETVSSGALLTPPDDRSEAQRREVHALRGRILKSYWERWFRLFGGDAELAADQSCIERGGCLELWFHTESFELLGEEPGDLALVDARAYVGKRATVERQVQRMNREFGFRFSDLQVPKRLCFDYSSDGPYKRVPLGRERWKLETGSSTAAELPVIEALYREHCAWIDADGDELVTPEDATSASILDSRLFRDAWRSSVASFSEGEF